MTVDNAGDAVGGRLGTFGMDMSVGCVELWLVKSVWSVFRVLWL